MKSTFIKRKYLGYFDKPGFSIEKPGLSLKNQVFYFHCAKYARATAGIINNKKNKFDWETNT